MAWLPACLDPFPQAPPALLFFFNGTATTEIYTLSLHDALPISTPDDPMRAYNAAGPTVRYAGVVANVTDRKSTRLNSSHTVISYAVFCLKKKNANSRTASGANHTTGHHAWRTLPKQTTAAVAKT